MKEIITTKELQDLTRETFQETADFIRDQTNHEIMRSAIRLMMIERMINNSLIKFTDELNNTDEHKVAWESLRNMVHIMVDNGMKVETIVVYKNEKE